MTRPPRTPAVRSEALLFITSGRNELDAVLLETFQHPRKVEPFEPGATYRNPSTKMMSPSECSIPEKRKVWPSGERLGPQRANK